MDNIICITDGWGPKFGGINAFNYDFVVTMAKLYENKDNVFCIELSDDVDEIVLEKKEGVNIVKINKLIDSHEIVEYFCKKHIDEKSKVLWVGHDVITGRKAIEYSKTMKFHDINSVSAVIHHMDYESYYTIKEGDGTKTKNKVEEQEYVLNNCDIVFSVGPKLKKSATVKLKKEKNVYELIPGIANIEPLEKYPENPFRAITFGRLDKSTEIIKQSKLAIAAFAKTIEKNKPYIGNDPCLTLFGLDKNQISKELKEIEETSYKYANRIVNINPYPYTENRSDLFSKLKNVHLCMMLSFHEGFGLVGWEAISAGVPLVVSKNSGLYEFIEESLGGKGTGCVYPIDIEGKPSSEGNDGENFTESDLKEVVKAIETINSKRDRAKSNALDLKELLKEYTWEKTVNDFLKGYFIEIGKAEVACTDEISSFGNEIIGNMDFVENKNDLPVLCKGNSQCIDKQKDNRLDIKFNSDRKNLSFLVVGDSQAGKSSFIRTFCNKATAEILKITAEGQTTRFSGIYDFAVKDEENTNVVVEFYSEQEFVERQCSKIIKKYRLDRNINENANNLLSNSVIKEEKNLKTYEEKDENWSKEVDEILKSMLGQDLISDEFFNFCELDLDEELGCLIKESDFTEIKSYSSFLKLLQSKLKIIYHNIIGKVNFFINSYKIKYPNVNIVINQENNENDVFKIQTMEFTLTQETSLLLTCCVRNANIFEVEALENVEISSLSGIIKMIKLELTLNNDYAKICESVGVKNIRLVDTYGLDHIPADNGDISVQSIKERLSEILNEEFREVESVIFITPMVGKATATDHRFQALIEAKRSIIPQIVYTKFDRYIENNFKPKGIHELTDDEFVKIVKNFNKKNLNKIKGNFDEILKAYYSDDVAEYRKQLILENVSYFMGTYEIEDLQKRDVANKNNIKYFLEIILSVLRNDNLGIYFENIDGDEIMDELKKYLDQDCIRNEISRKLKEMLTKGQDELAHEYSCSHGNTKNAFWRRINCNMFGFTGNLSIRNILKESFTRNLAKDAGENKDSNLGNIIINEFMIEKKLNVFFRECINKFSDYYFCTGCLPCNTLDFKNCDMSSSCNNRGVRRVRRKDSCYQISNGIYSGSRTQSRYCSNSGIYGIGLFDKEYGEIHGCDDRCYWSYLFNKNNDLNKGICLDGFDITEDFICLFIQFCMYQLEKSKKSTETLPKIKQYYYEIYS